MEETPRALLSMSSSLFHLTPDDWRVYSVSSNEMPDRRYTVDANLRACEVLKAFHFDSEVLALRDIVERTGLNKVTAFRTVYSLAEGGFVERLNRDQYHRRLHAPQSKRIRIGYHRSTAGPSTSRTNRFPSSSFMHFRMEGKPT